MTTPDHTGDAARNSTTSADANLDVVYPQLAVADNLRLEREKTRVMVVG